MKLTHHHILIISLLILPVLILSGCGMGYYEDTDVPVFAPNNVLAETEENESSKMVTYKYLVADLPDNINLAEQYCERLKKAGYHDAVYGMPVYGVNSLGEETVSYCITYEKVEGAVVTLVSFYKKGDYYYVEIGY